MGPKRLFTFALLALASAPHARPDSLSDRYPVSRSPYLPGWPVQLPGEGKCTPVVADLLGDGKLEIVVTCGSAGDPAKGAAAGRPLLYALRTDGTVLPGFPVDVGLPDPRPVKPGDWPGSPSVLHRNGKDELVLVAPHNGIVVVNGEGKVRKISPKGVGIDGKDHPPLADLDRDGIPDVVVGKFTGNVDGGPVSTWPPERFFRNGFSPAVGDALGNGSLSVFTIFYNNPDGSVDLGGFDADGNPLPGWPQNIDCAEEHGPTIGDVLGNGQMQVFAIGGQALYAWNPDGSPLPHTRGDGKYTGILKAGVSNWTAPVSLADLDGDGKADIILFDTNSRTLRAWHGDGTPVFEHVPAHAADAQITANDRLQVSISNRDSAPPPRAITVQPDKHGQIEVDGVGTLKAVGLTLDELTKAIEETAAPLKADVAFQEDHYQLRPAAAPPADDSADHADLTPTDGLIASLPTLKGHGVSVVSLGDDPRRMDFFVGTYWVARQPDGTTTVVNMAGQDVETNWVQPTIADVDGDGKADAIFCTKDGRVFVYQTGLAYHAAQMQWPTVNGNFQHTAAWRSPRPAGGSK